MTAVTYGTTSSGGGAAFLIWLYVAVYVLLIIGFWVIFTKAGEAGWKSIIPIYNTIIWLKIIGHPWWWILLLLIPIVNFVILIMMWYGLSTSFGKGVGFTVGLIFLPYVFVPILGLGSARYLGPGGSGAIAPPAPPMPT
jgi:hypothetical protein